MERRIPRLVGRIRPRKKPGQEGILGQLGRRVREELRSGHAWPFYGALLTIDRRTAGSEIPAASSQAAESRMIDSLLVIAGFTGLLWK